MSSTDNARERAAAILGMKVREVVDVETVRDGVVATTHDGRRTLIRKDGTTTPADGPASEDEDEAVVEAGPTKTRARR